jgi:hypothetical protein
MLSVCLVERGSAMGIDLVSLGVMLALFGGLLLLLVWLILSRRFAGCLLVVLAWVVLLAAVATAHSPMGLLGVCVVGVFLVSLAWAIIGLLRARPPRVPVYQPVSRRLRRR